jgi:hypothetical protein
MSSAVTPLAGHYRLTLTYPDGERKTHHLHIDSEADSVILLLMTAGAMRCGVTVHAAPIGRPEHSTPTLFGQPMAQALQPFTSRQFLAAVALVCACAIGVLLAPEPQATHTTYAAAALAAPASCPPTSTPPRAP